MFMMFAGIGLLLVFLFPEISKLNRKPFVPGIRTDSQKENRWQSESKYSDFVKPATQNLLYSMCANDVGLAHKLVSYELGATEEERWQYAIHNLERDRY